MMKALIIYHNQKCSTSRQVLNTLKERGFDPEVVSYLQNPPSKQEMMNWLKKGPVTPAQLIRWKEDVVKTSGIKKDSVTADQAISLILAHPVAMERPVLVSETAAIVARPLSDLDNLLSLL